MHERASEVPEGFRKHVKFREEVDIPKLEALLKDYVFSQSIGTLNPPKFGKVLAAKSMRDSKEDLCVLYSVESSGPADRPPYEAFDEPDIFEEVVYVTDYISISRAPKR
ncbi:unnamed protein product [Symbiodinium necroappetens]|uniref:Uncharacterized protein n=1 Tax=Symbiodinium necroappetens TaxID=1628268 RepID=A0A813AH39_9DINO|nr:unnamed protein product [Symbiodinium necroappetens]